MNKITHNKKVSHIIDEINTYLIDKNVSEILSSIKNNEKETIITISANIQFDEEEFDNLKKSLSASHEDEYDEYWCLVGEGMHCDELCLVSSIVDSSIIEYNNGNLKIEFLIYK